MPRTKDLPLIGHYCTTWLFAIVFLCPHLLKGQGNTLPISPYFKNYTTEDGLPSNEVYQVVQDKNNYLWFATDRGVARYNGTDFRIYGTEDGFQGVSIFGFAFDKYDRLWCYSYQNEIYHFDGNRFHRHPVSDTLRSVMNKISNLFWEEDTLWLYDYYSTFRLKPDGQLISVPRVIRDSSYISVHQANDSSYVPSVTYDRPAYSKGIAIRTRDGKIIHKKFDALLPTPHRPMWLYSTGDKEDNGYIIWSPYLILWNRDTIYWKEFPAGLNHSINLDHQQNLWIGTYNGIHVFTRDNYQQPKADFLKDVNITCSLQDAEGGYWVTTHRRGVYYLPKAPLQTLPIKNTMTNSRGQSMQIIEDTLYYFSLESKIYKCILSTGAYEIISNAPGPGKLVKNNASEMVFVGQNKERFRHIPDIKGCYYTESINYLTLLPQQKILLSFYNYHTNTTYHCERKNWEDLKTDTLVTMQYDQRQRFHYPGPEYLYMGNRFGLTIVDLKTKEVVRKKNDLFNTRVTGIAGYDSLIVVATAGEGLLFILGDSLLGQIKRKDGLPDNLCNDIYIDEKQTLWVSTNSGLCRITDIDKDFFCNIHNYTRSEGMPSRQILSTITENGWVASITPQGIAYFKEEELKNTPPGFPVFLSSIEINKQPADELSLEDLSHKMNDIFITYEAVTFQYAEELQFRYRLLGLDSSWRSTSGFDIQYNNLSPGKYTFELQGGTLYDGWSTQKASFGFTILPPFWTTWWFLLLMIFFIAVNIFILFRWRLGVISRRQQVRNRLFFYRQQAIGLQMNPHFFFNSLASMQANILDNNQKGLLQQLTSFAKLIRYIFEVSLKNMVSLKEEISLLNHYLEFEKLRLKDELEYEFDLDASLDQSSMLIPTMLVQPIVENAVKHGRSARENKTCIRISISAIDDYLLIEVRDKGKGYDPLSGKQLKGYGGHVSAGLKLVRKRLVLLQEWLKQPAQLEIISHGTESKDPGTSVQVRIPIIKDENKYDKSRYR